MWQYLRVLALAMVLVVVVNSEREHKVHNIVLYPERESWCQTTPIRQVVAMPGFEPVTIANNVCVGACYSYSIPRTQPAEPGELIGPYCDSCQPVDTQCYHVTLQALAKNPDATRSRQKRVQIITNCSCLSCTKTESRDCEILDENTPELPLYMFSELHSNTTQHQEAEEPELLNHQFPRHRPPPSGLLNTYQHTNEARFELNNKLVELLKSIQAEGADDASSNFSYDKDQLEELLRIIEGSERELSDKNLMDFVNFVNVHNSEDLELDLSKLKEVLQTFEREKLMEKHRLHDSTNGNDNVNANTGEPNLAHFKANKQRNVASLNMLSSDEDTIKKHDLNSGAKTEHRNSKNHHHHVGDEEIIAGQHGHLVAGPHGSLVFAPDIKMEEKFNIDSDLLKPNHENVIVSYENHPGHNSNHKRRK